MCFIPPRREYLPIKVLVPRCPLYYRGRIPLYSEFYSPWHTFIADPYVKVIATYKDKSVHEWKSSVKHKTLAPVYNESFSFEIEDAMRVAMDTGSIALSCYIVDFDYFSQDDTMGVVSIGKDVESELGRRHWTEMLQSPCHRISFWHPIQLVS